MRALLYQNRGDHFSSDLLIDTSTSLTDKKHSADKLQSVIDAVREYNQEMTAVVAWSPDRAEDEVFHAIPLFGAGTAKDRPLLAILLIGNSRKTYVELKRHIRSAALLVGGGGIVLAILLSSWAAARVTRPVEQLAHAAQEVAAGNWNVRVDVSGSDELGQLADSFNRMTSELLAQKERLMQAERVAACSPCSSRWKTWCARGSKVQNNLKKCSARVPEHCWRKLRTLRESLQGSASFLKCRNQSCGQYS
jgi:HAMP domain-containing protein